MASNFRKKIRQEIIPLLFFGTVVLIKLYFLIDIVFIQGNYEKILHAFSLLEDYPNEEIHYWLVKVITYIAYNIIAILFDSLVFASYLIRQQARSKARGFWETAYPLATVLIPVTGFTLLSIPSIRAYLPRFDPQYMIVEMRFPVIFPQLMSIIGVSLGAIGATLSITALWSLKRSFSLMTEVRTLVTTGLYRRIRHPLYMSEIIHMTGVALLAATPVAIGLLIVAVGMQIGRAKIEERKLARVLPEYAPYKAQTGFLWPKLL